MADELKLVSPELLTDINEKEVSVLISQIMEKSNKNMEGICELTLECTALLASAENRTNMLDEQSSFKRLIGNFTGKNIKLQNAILHDNTNALYIAQEIINRIMSECESNRELLIAVNNRIHDVYLELKENQNDLTAGVLMVRKTIVAFYKKYLEDCSVLNNRISKMEEHERRRCPECQTKMRSWQLICPKCGCVHYLKDGESGEHTRKKLKQISEVIKEGAKFEEILWNETAQKTARVLNKVNVLAEIGELPSYTKELAGDIEELLHKCKDAEFQIAIVGVMKAGKSFLMNALMGIEIASVEVNPETAALTKFRSADGFYINVKFHNEKQWTKLKDSARISKNVGEHSLKEMLKNPAIEKMERKWIGHKDLFNVCGNLSELKEKVKRYTSSQTAEHLFVSEVEVGVDRNTFNMPQEVVFVDTPGLKDPVKYRSEITREYIKKADAVLIAVPTAALTTEGNEIITTVLDCTDANKAYIVATQKDLKDKEEDCEKIVSLWVKQLIAAKRYPNERSVRNRIILTSAKMDLLMSKWLSLSEEEREDLEQFSIDDYTALEHFVKRTLNNHRYSIENLPDDEESSHVIERNAGILTLRRKLSENLITKYREIKILDIQDAYLRCKKQIRNICKNDIRQCENAIAIAEAGTEAIRKRVEELSMEQKTLQEESEEIKKEANKLKYDVAYAIEVLNRKGTK